MLGSAVVLAAVSAIILSSCGGTIPEGVAAIKPFEVKRYVGKWYEIARLDFKYEKGLNNTTATYSFNSDGKIKVVNRGYDFKKGKWKQVTGKAKFVKDSNEAKLKVSFFGPFYSGYNVIAIDDEYQYALVAGESLKYLWLLSRKVTMPANVKQDFLDKAKVLGYNTDELVWIQHGQK